MDNFFLYQQHKILDDLLKKRVSFLETKITDKKKLQNMKSKNELNLLNKESIILDAKLKTELISYYKRETFSDGFDAYLKSNNIYVCPYCGNKYLFGERFFTSTEFDHFLPKNDFPRYAGNPYNIIPVCRDCNNAKKKQSIEGEIDVLNFYKGQSYLIEKVIKNESEFIKSSNQSIIDICKIENGYKTNRNSVFLQSEIERMQIEIDFLGCSKDKLFFIKKSNYENKIYKEPYANFDKQFVERVDKNNFL